MNKPTHYVGRPVTMRLPRTESVEFTVRANDKPHLGEICNNQDKIFEVVRVTVKLTALADGAVPDPQPSVLDRLVKIGLTDISKNERIASAQREDLKRAGGLPLRQVTDSTFEWIPTEPIAFWRSEGLEFQVVPRGTPKSTAADAPQMFLITFRNERREIDAVRIEITIEGANCILGDKAGVENPLG
jgi:hypothetical protein